MKPLSHIVTKFGLIQILLVGLGFLITRAFLRAHTKILDAGVPLSSVHWLAQFIGSFGLALLLVPVLWCAAVLWLGRHDFTSLHYNPHVFRVGMATTIVLGIVSALSVVHAMDALFRIESIHHMRE